MGLYSSLPFPGVANPLWGPPRMVHVQPLNPMFPTSQPPQQQYMGETFGFIMPSQ
jgi:hypothetical protein